MRFARAAIRWEQAPFRKFWNRRMGLLRACTPQRRRRPGLKRHARNYYFGMHAVQKQELHFNEKQENYHRAPGIKEVLQPLPRPYGASGDAVRLFGRNIIRPVARIGRAAVSKTACWGFESLLACQLFSID